MAAYECVLTAKVLHHRSIREDNAEAQRLLDRALALDPNYAHAHAWKACVTGPDMGLWLVRGRATRREGGLRSCETALALDDNDATCTGSSPPQPYLQRTRQGRLSSGTGAQPQSQHDLIVVQQGELLTWLGRPEEGIDWIKKAMRLNPYHPERFWSHLGRAQYSARAYAEAMASFSKMTAPDSSHHAFLAASSAQLGDGTAASAHAREVLARDPSFTARGFLSTLHYRQPSDAEHVREGLLKAGLPD